MQQSVYEGLLTQGGSASLPGELGGSRIQGRAAGQALVATMMVAGGWHIYNTDSHYSMIAGGALLLLGLGGLIDSAY